MALLTGIYIIEAVKGEDDRIETCIRKRCEVCGVHDAEVELWKSLSACGDHRRRVVDANVPVRKRAEHWRGTSRADAEVQQRDPRRQLRPEEGVFA